MRIQNNIMAINTGRLLSENNRKVSKDLERLSSGYRINRSADDAAGLGISEKMRAQITGLTMAQKNVQDGISALQVADGGMTEQTAMLQRLVELGTQAANGIYSQQERQSIQDEANQLIDEIDSIAQGTNFNECKLLGGNPSMTSPSYSGSGGGAPYTRDISDFDASTITDVLQGGGPAFYFQCSTCDPDAAIYLDMQSEVTQLSRSSELNTIRIGIKGVKDGVQLADKISKEMSKYTAGGAASIAGLHHFTVSSSGDGKFTFEYGSGSGGINFKDNLFDNGLKMKLQVGADTDDVMTLRFANMKTAAVLTGDIDLTSHESAAKSLKVIKDGINYVSRARGRLGAYQNRLEHTLNNLGVMAENMTAAESRVRDVDMAKGMMSFAKDNIVAQASQAMLAQANQIPESVLQMLQ